MITTSKYNEIIIPKSEKLVFSSYCVSKKNVSFNSNLGHPAKDSHLMHIWSIRIKKKLQNKKLWFF